ncbi:MAG TPA: DNA-formamidopyrimidine glycosylase family protein [Actinomycetes bacterium]|nr:DNA-formamidopyrimidine glycosylase family protein [Actinomycetes bacterium]
MPELPEVEALTDFLSERLVGRVVARVDVAGIAALKTYDPPVTSLGGLTITGVARHGKFVDIDVDGLHLVIHLSRAGWVRWREELPSAPLKPGKGPLVLRLHLDDGSGLDVTEAGTKKRLAVYVVRSPDEVPGVARLGPEPLTLTREQFDEILDAHARAQIKGLLRDQSVIAGIGNAYSDEILHVAKLSPFATSGRLDESQRARLFEAVGVTLRDAVARSAGLPASELKDGKRAAMRVHGRTGETCPECGDVVREVSFADSSLQYCATCQTGGKPLADRRLSRLLK